MKYHPDEKTAVMMLLQRNGFDFPSTAAQTGIPEMTLRRWHKQISPHLRKYPPPLTNPAGEMLLPAFENDMDTLKFVRRQIMDELARIAASLKDVPGVTTPYQRSLVLSQLLDKIMKLDAHIKPYNKELVVRVLREDKPIGYLSLDDQIPDESNGRIP